MKYTVYFNSKRSHSCHSSLSVDSNEKLREQSIAENQKERAGTGLRREHKYEFSGNTDL